MADRLITSIKLTTTTGNYEENHAAIIYTNQPGKRKLLLRYQNTDNFINYLIDLQNKAGILQSEHVPIRLENRAEFKGNLYKIAESSSRLAQCGVLILSVAGFRSLSKVMQGSINNQCRLLFSQRGWL